MKLTLTLVMTVFFTVFMASVTRGTSLAIPPITSAGGYTLDDALDAYKEKDYALAHKIWFVIGEAGSRDATYNIGALFYKGLGVTQDYKQAAVWYLKAASRDHPDPSRRGHIKAEYELGLMFEKGQGVKQDYKEAAKWFREAAGINSFSWFVNTSGRTLYEGGWADSVRRHSVLGDPAAQLAMGLDIKRKGVMEQFELGLHEIKDKQNVEKFVQALSWLIKAAEQGNTEAQFQVGYMYSQGEGVKKDPTQAIAWFRKAADQGNDDAKDRIGWLYLHDEEVQDHKRALAMYRKLADEVPAGFLDRCKEICGM